MNLRRDIAEHEIARWKTRGIPIDEYPNFFDLVELWTTGTIGSDEMRRGMRGSSASGPMSRSSPPGVKPVGKTTTDEDHELVAIRDAGPETV